MAMVRLPIPARSSYSVISILGGFQMLSFQPTMENFFDSHLVLCRRRSWLLLTSMRVFPFPSFAMILPVFPMSPLFKCFFCPNCLLHQNRCALPLLLVPPSPLAADSKLYCRSVRLFFLHVFWYALLFCSPWQFCICTEQIHC